MGQPWPLFRLFSALSNKQYNFYNKSMWKNVHPLYNAGIWTHDISYMSRHPLPLDHSFHKSSFNRPSHSEQEQHYLPNELYFL